jgi:hypothetical protein
METIKFFNKINANELQLYKNIIDVYFTYEYGKCCEYSDNAEWECCIYKDLTYVYLKQSISHKNVLYFDLISPYGYSGYNYLKQDTFDEFIKLFRIEAIKRNYITEVVKQNPYINKYIDIDKYYNLLRSKIIYAIDVDNFDIYYKNILNCKKRNMYTKSIKKNLKFNIVKLSISSLNDKFLNLYFKNMYRINSKKYYYFNKEYFNELINIANSYLTTVIDENNETIGSAIIFEYSNYIHYHLSCNNNSMNCITDFLIINILKNFGINRLFILGGGLEDNDNLSKYKKSLSNKSFKYNIYKNILNKSIYDEILNKSSNEKNINMDFFPVYRN